MAMKKKYIGKLRAKPEEGEAQRQKEKNEDRMTPQSESQPNLEDVVRN